MIVVQGAFPYPAEKIGRMQEIVPEVEQFIGGLDGCEAFTFSFAPSKPGTLLTTELWRDAQSLLAHVPVVNSAPEVAEWRDLVEGIDLTMFTAEPLSMEALRAQGGKNE